MIRQPLLYLTFAVVAALLVVGGVVLCQSERDERPEQSSRRADPPPARAERRPAAAPAAAAVGAAADATGLPADKTRRDYVTAKSCKAAGCHAQMETQRWVHGPVAAKDACGVCHVAEGKPADHKFAQSRPKEELCTFCHAPRAGLPSTHKPYVEFECLRCHNPHGGPLRSFLRTSVVELCGTCHERDPVAHPHFPASSGDCLSCHEGHQSRHERLLTLPIKDLCVTCHEDLRGVHEPTDPLVHVHAALTDEKNKSCVGCHNPHGSGFDHMLASEPNALCARCHEQILKPPSDVKSTHGALSGQSTCSGCHMPHKSQFEHLLRASPDTLCLKCHNKEMRLADKRRVADIHAQITDATSVHSPVSAGACTACHVAHSSPHNALLRASYPEETYAPFAESTYELCFQCHDTRIVEQERTTVTDFRDGDRNLHFVHVNREKGRTCGICHEPHGSSSPSLVRKQIAFGPGGWEMPIGFHDTPAGGGCASGCHKALDYDNSTVARRPGDAPRLPVPPSTSSGG